MNKTNDVDAAPLHGIVTVPLRWIAHLFVPPLRYWTVYHNGHKRLMTIRQRFNPGVEKTYTSWGVVTLDGPHETQDEAVRRLAFWRAQYDRDGVSCWSR